MVDDLLDVARVTQGKIAPHWEAVDLVRLLRRVADTVKRTRLDRRQQRFHLELGDAPLTVRGDPLRLEQVFTNVLDNASKYTPEGGRVELLAERLDDASVRVSVCDNGAGIAQESLGKVFNLFEQADVPLARSSGGLGVGLTLVRSLVEMHDGQVHAHSQGPGTGTRIAIVLPLQGEGEIPGAAQSESETPQGTQRRILIIEDNIDAQQTLKLLLEAWGHDVHVASDGRAGIEAILALAPDVAFVDIGLPIVDGYEVARRITSAGLGKPPLLVALTGYGDPEQRVTALNAGFQHHVVKPADPQRLQEIVQNAA
jgi:two-component system, sensor histidine kinase